MDSRVTECLAQNAKQAGRPAGSAAAGTVPDEAERAIPGFKGPESHQYKDDMWVYRYMPDTPAEASGAEKADA